MLIRISIVFGFFICRKMLVILTTPAMFRDQSKQFRGLASTRQKGFGLLILDEAQYYCNPQSRSYLELEDSCRLFNKALALTGTPMVNSVADIHSLFSILNPGVLGDLGEFMEKMANKDVQEIQADSRIGDGMVRRLQSDPAVAPYLPRTVFSYVPVRLNALGVEEYSKAFQKDSIKISATDGHKVQQICGRMGGYEDGKMIPEGAKFVQLKEKLRASLACASPNNKVLIFCELVATVVTMKSKLQKEHPRAHISCYHGDQTKKERDKVVEDFKSSDGPSVLIMNIKAGGVGINLPEARHVIFYELPWTNKDILQALSRAVRADGSTNAEDKHTVNISVLYTEHTGEEHVINTIEKKKLLRDIIIQPDSSTPIVTKESQRFEDEIELPDDDSSDEADTRHGQPQGHYPEFTTLYRTTFAPKKPNAGKYGNPKDEELWEAYVEKGEHKINPLASAGDRASSLIKRRRKAGSSLLDIHDLKNQNAISSASSRIVRWPVGQFAQTRFRMDNVAVSKRDDEVLEIKFGDNDVGKLSGEGFDFVRILFLSIFFLILN